MTRGGRLRRALSNLFVVYAAASLLPVMVLGVVLVRGYGEQAQRRGLAQGRAQAAVIQEMAIAPALSGDDLSLGITARERERLQAATDLAIFHGSVARLRLRTFSGQVTFSDDGSTAGALPSTDRAFRAATRGRTSVDIVRDERAGPGLLVRVLQPVVANASGRATGVVELYLPYGPIVRDIRIQTDRTVRQLAAGLAGLYAVLALIAWYTTRRLHRYAADRERQALHDGLTGLPNREWFRVAGELALDRSRRTDEAGVVALLDLDHFKEVNDSLGHHAGDELLRVVAARLRDGLRTDDTVARLGGDEFGMVLPRVDEPTAVALLDRVRRQLAEEVLLDGVPVRAEASVGVAAFGRDTADLESVLRRADEAMYHGKKDGSGVVVHHAALAPTAQRTLTLKQELRAAIARDELRLHYQPVVGLADGRIRGVEALVRWQHPVRGLLPPGEFLPAAEESALIEPLTGWVLDRALRDRASWAEAGREWTLSVNISARSVGSGSLVETVRTLLHQHAVPGRALRLEITETALAGDQQLAARALAELAVAGVEISIDDFGVGYTSLAQLRDLPVAEVKVDRRFVTHLDSSPRDRAIVSSVIHLARGLDCRVTAEGVETAEVADWLVAAGCDQGQGWLFARAMPWEQLAQRIPRSGSVAGERWAVTEGSVS